MSVVKVTKENYQALVEANELVLLDFWAVWCGPCKMIAPFIEEIAAERPDVLVGKVDVDNDMELATQFGIASIPTLIVFKDGREASRIIGFRPKDAILAELK